MASSVFFTNRPTSGLADLQASGLPTCIARNKLRYVYDVSMSSFVSSNNKRRRIFGVPPGPAEITTIAAAAAAAAPPSSTMTSGFHAKRPFVIYVGGAQMDQLVLYSPSAHYQVENPDSFRLPVGNASLRSSSTTSSAGSGLSLKSCRIRQLFNAGEYNWGDQQNILCRTETDLFLSRTMDPDRLVSVQTIDVRRDNRYISSSQYRRKSTTILEPVQQWRLPQQEEGSLFGKGSCTVVDAACQASHSSAVLLAENGQVYEWTAAAGVQSRLKVKLYSSTVSSSSSSSSFCPPPRIDCALRPHQIHFVHGNKWCMQDFRCSSFSSSSTSSGMESTPLYTHWNKSAYFTAVKQHCAQEHLVMIADTMSNILLMDTRYTKSCYAQKCMPSFHTSMLQFHSLVDNGGRGNRADLCLSASADSSHILAHVIETGNLFGTSAADDSVSYRRTRASTVDEVPSSRPRASSGRGSGSLGIASSLQLLWSATPFGAEHGVAWGTQCFPIVGSNAAAFMQKNEMIGPAHRAKIAAVDADDHLQHSSQLSGFTLVEVEPNRKTDGSHSVSKYYLVQQNGHSGDVFSQELILISPTVRSSNSSSGSSGKGPAIIPPVSATGSTAAEHEAVQVVVSENSTGGSATDSDDSEGRSTTNASSKSDCHNTTPNSNTDSSVASFERRSTRRRKVAAARLQFPAMTGNRASSDNDSDRIADIVNHQLVEEESALAPLQMGLPCGERIRPTAAVSKLKVEFPEPSNYFMKTVPENCLLGFDVVMVNPSDLRRDLMKLTRVPKSYQRSPAIINDFEEAAAVFNAALSRLIEAIPVTIESSLSFVGTRRTLWEMWKYFFDISNKRLNIIIFRKLLNECNAFEEADMRLQSTGDCRATALVGAADGCTHSATEIAVPYALVGSSDNVRVLQRDINVYSAAPDGQLKKVDASLTARNSAGRTTGRSLKLLSSLKNQLSSSVLPSSLNNYSTSELVDGSKEHWAALSKAATKSNGNSSMKTGATKDDALKWVDKATIHYTTGERRIGQKLSFCTCSALNIVRKVAAAVPGTSSSNSNNSSSSSSAASPTVILPMCGGIECVAPHMLVYSVRKIESQGNNSSSSSSSSSSKSTASVKTSAAGWRQDINVGGWSQSKGDDISNIMMANLHSKWDQWEQ